MEWTIENQSALSDLMPEVMAALGTRRKIALLGEMGAGKTTFVKEMCRHLGVQGNTASPTFSLVNQYNYTAADGTMAIFHHLDLYRLNTVQEALDIGLEDMLYDPWFCVLEWPQLVENILPDDTIHLEITIISENARLLKIQNKAESPKQG